MDQSQRPFLKLTVWVLVSILIFGLVEFIFPGSVGADHGGSHEGSGGATEGISGIGEAVAIFNFIFIALIILAVIGLLIGLVGITICYFKRHSQDFFDDDRNIDRDEDEEYDRYRRK
ncbi:hypothetical protein [Halobacillus naozhouensis]|uniref:DUF4064 domain-containing protein n=1 Tax=Halobacillus naozhouensis TaxID=554880 RepID=A0ABY8IXJ1_9BACI|nr:hypothetical protein [Halobacillus naozhouensis]WFT74491.1 hypothetical protein P9989_19400 [Halobacillus naozhouensis]